MELHRALGDDEGAGDVRVGLALDHVLEHVELARGSAGRAAPSRRRPAAAAAARRRRRARGRRRGRSRRRRARRVRASAQLATWRSSWRWMRRRRRRTARSKTRRSRSAKRHSPSRSTARSGAPAVARSPWRKPITRPLEHDRRGDVGSSQPMTSERTRGARPRRVAVGASITTAAAAAQQLALDQRVADLHRRLAAARVSVCAASPASPGAVQRLGDERCRRRCG